MPTTRPRLRPEPPAEVMLADRVAELGRAFSGAGLISAKAPATDVSPYGFRAGRVRVGVTDADPSGHYHLTLFADRTGHTIVSEVALSNVKPAIVVAVVQALAPTTGLSA